MWQRRQRRQRHTDQVKEVATTEAADTAMVEAEEACDITAMILLCSFYRYFTRKIIYTLLIVPTGDK